MADKKHDSDQRALAQSALHFHQYPKPGKLEIVATKALGNQRDLALAYSPGVAAPCLEIASKPETAAQYTSRGNLVAVISNGTAVLGLGAIGALASKPVMEGKAVLFKKFAGIDVFDVEVDETEPQKFINIVRSLEPTFGGVNLEDISAPGCFEIEDALKAQMNIPVFHDDQHGTAIIVGAAVLNALKLSGKHIHNVKIVCSGAGAAATACLNLLVELGANLENIFVTDKEGVLNQSREGSMDKWRAHFIRRTDQSTLKQIMVGADVFIGLSAGGIVSGEMLKTMGEKPLIMALANPEPEIRPEVALEARADAIICTGRSDYPNQVNNVLCFPFIFRGALDCGASTINEKMKMAAVHAIADLAQETVSVEALRATGKESENFGPNYLIPNPFDPRLIERISVAVAESAEQSGVATRPIADMKAYADSLKRFVYRSGIVMKPMMEAAQHDPKHIVFAEGEDERVLRAVQVLCEEKMAKTTLVARPGVVKNRIKRYGLNIKPGVDFEIINPESDPRYRDYVELYHRLAARRGISPEAAKAKVRTNQTVIAALTLARGDADAMICGLEGDFLKHIRDIRSVIGLRSGVTDFSTLSMLLMQRGTFFFADTYITPDPSPEELEEMVFLATDHIEAFGIEPRVALLSHSSFGSRQETSARKMRQVYQRLKLSRPDMMIEGEMQGNVALNANLRRRLMAHSTFEGEANLFVFPNIESANLAVTLLQEMENCLSVGPILLGAAQPAHVLTPAVTSRGIVNMASIAVQEAQMLAKNRR